MTTPLPPETWLTSGDCRAWNVISETISRRILSHCIVSINGVEFGSDTKDRFEKIGKMDKAVKLKLYEELLDLNKAVAILVTGSSGNSLERLLTGRV